MENKPITAILSFLAGTKETSRLFLCVQVLHKCYDGNGRHMTSFLKGLGENLVFISFDYRLILTNDKTILQKIQILIKSGMKSP